MKVYRIRNWEKHFENHDSRKLRSLTWVPVPNKHDGRGYRRVAALRNSVQVFCAWSLLYQVASRTPTRGVLADEDGAFTASDLSAKTGYPALIFEQAFEALTAPGIAWLEEVDTPDEQAKGDSISGESPGTPRSPPPQGKGREGNGRTEDKTVGSAVALPLPAPKITDAQFIGLLKADAAYEGIDIDREHAKMNRWCEQNHRKPSRKRLVNWLNRVEKPMNCEVKPSTTVEPVWSQIKALENLIAERQRALPAVANRNLYPEEYERDIKAREQAKMEIRKLQSRLSALRAGEAGNSEKI